MHEKLKTPRHLHIWVHFWKDVPHSEVLTENEVHSFPNHRKRFLDIAVTLPKFSVRKMYLLLLLKISNWPNDYDLEAASYFRPN